MECKCDKKLWAAVILGVSLIAFGFILKSAVNNYINKDRKVTVKGLSEREEPANLITWSFSTSVTGDDLPSLNRRMEQTRDRVIRFLSQNGLPGDAIRYYPPDVDDRLNNRWSNDALPYNYKITTSFNVTSSEIDKVRELITKQGDLISQGISLNYSYVNYDYTGFQDLKQEMIEEAVANARTTADQFVKNYGSKLGKIITADQGTFSINSKDDDPSMMKIRGVATITYALED